MITRWGCVFIRLDLRELVVESCQGKSSKHSLSPYGVHDNDKHILCPSQVGVYQVASHLDVPFSLFQHAVLRVSNVVESSEPCFL